MKYQNIEDRLKNAVVELVEARFPKGNKERGNATVMMGLFLICALDEIRTILKERGENENN